VSRDKRIKQSKLNEWMVKLTDCSISLEMKLLIELSGVSDRDTPRGGATLSSITTLTTNPISYFRFIFL
jgi:hypothetical protein